MSQLAINGGTPIRSLENWPAWPVCDEREERAVLEVLRSGRWWFGEKIKEFEEAFAAFQDARFGVSCTSGTAALKLGLFACGVGAGDEVIVPAYTFIATAAAPLLVNAVPVFADVELDTGNLDLTAVESLVTEKTKAVIPVHFAGLPADMDALGDIARRHNLRIIEDACHAWGTKWRGKGAGALGDCGAFSFQMSKNITAGEGGILLTDDEGIAERAASYCNFGRIKEGAFYEHFLVGDNMRMTEMQAAILLVQLSRLEEQTLRRQHNARLLNRLLSEIPGVSIMREDPRAEPRAYHLYMFRFRPESWNGVTRDRFLEALRAEGVPCWAGYPMPLYKNPLFQRRARGSQGCPLSCPYYGREMDYTRIHLPNVEWLCGEACWIGQQYLLAEESAMHDIAAAVAKIWEHREELRNA